jgi:galactose-1-phosphate uridylyltransferase
MWDRVQLSDFRDDEAREAVGEILFEVHDTWKEEFAAKEKFVQGIIDNAKKITDFSNNEKWKAVMDLLPKAA